MDAKVSYFKHTNSMDDILAQANIILWELPNIRIMRAIKWQLCEELNPGFAESLLWKETWVDIAKNRLANLIRENPDWKRLFRLLVKLQRIGDKFNILTQEIFELKRDEDFIDNEEWKIQLKTINTELEKLRTEIQKIEAEIKWLLSKQRN